VIRALLFALATLATTGCIAPAPTAQLIYYPQPGPAARAVHLVSFNALGDLVPKTAAFVYLITGGGASPFVRTPAGIDFRNDHLYICDTGSGVVHDWNLATGSARTIGASHDGSLITPVDVAVDDAGTIFVADTGVNQVVAYDVAGSLKHKIVPADAKTYRPVALAVHADKLYVTDVARHRVDVFDASTGAPLDSFGKPGSATGSLYYPTGIATNAAGQAIVSEMMNSRVQVFDENGQVMQTFGQPGNRYGDMGKPKHVTVAPDGVIFVADAEFQRIHLFDDQGRLLMLLGGSKPETNETLMPLGVAIAASLPSPVADLVPDGFSASYFLFVTSSTGDKRISLYAIGKQRPR